VFLFAAAAAFAFLAAPAPPLPPAAYFWTDNSVVNNLAISGFDRAVTDFGLVGRKFSYDEEEEQLNGLYGDPWWEGLTRAEIDERWYAFLEDHVREVAGDGTGLVYVFGFLAAEIERIATAHPDTIFVFGPGIARQPNVVLLNADDSEPAYLAGAAAALKTESGTVGFIGGMPFPGVWGFHAGFEAGVRDTDPDIEVVTEYLSPDDPIVAFSDFDRARDTALDMYEAGADIIFHAAGDAGLGVFEAARLFSAEEGRHVWAIGVDSDQYWTVTQLPGVTDPEGWQAHILTSVLKPIEPMTYAVLRAYAERNLEGGEWYWGLAETGGEGISYSGGYLDDIRPQLEALRARIVSGEIEVPCVPQELMDQARALGMGPDDCHG
jgi:basic membrane protein A